MPTAPNVFDRPAIDDHTANDNPWNVFLWNDPVTPENVVVGILQTVVSLPREKAKQLMLEAHNNGKTVVFSGKREEAQHIAEQLHAYGLQATVGRDV